MKQLFFHGNSQFHGATLSQMTEKFRPEMAKSSQSLALEKPIRARKINMTIKDGNNSTSAVILSKLFKTF